MQRPTLTLSEDQLATLPAREGIHVFSQKGDEMFLISSFCNCDDAVSYARLLALRGKEADCYHVYAEWANSVVITTWPADLEGLTEKGDEGNV